MSNRHRDDKYELVLMHLMALGAFRPDDIKYLDLISAEES